MSEVMNVVGDCMRRNVVVFDDICDTAGSICNAATALKERGALEIVACVTHAILSDPACQRLSESCFDLILFSDSIDISTKIHAIQKPVKIISCADILAINIRCIHDSESIMD